jgi:hypothetical protein
MAPALPLRVLLKASILVDTLVALLLALGLMLLAAATPPAASAEPTRQPMPQDARICAALARAAEDALGIPADLLLAVGVVESGRYDQSVGRAEPWPWTINAEGKGARFDTKAAAIAAVEALQREGVSSIDVGCMQVNLAYHGAAFASLEEAFDPVINVAYGAHFLDSLHDARGSWSKAVAAYHSSTPARGIPYRRKVASTWLDLRGEIEVDAAADARRARVAAAYQSQRQAFAERQAEIVRLQEVRRSIRLSPQIAPPDSGIVAIRGNAGAEPTAEPAESGTTEAASGGVLREPARPKRGADRRAAVEPAASVAAPDCADGKPSEVALIDRQINRLVADQMLDLGGFARQVAALDLGGDAPAPDPERWRSAPDPARATDAGLAGDPPGPNSFDGRAVPAGTPLEAETADAACPPATVERAKRKPKRGSRVTVIRG